MTWAEGLALLVAGVSLILTVVQGRRSDRIQERLAVVEEDRRREETRPELTMQAAYDGQFVVVTIRNGDRFDLDLVEIIEVIEAPPMIQLGIKSVVGAAYSHPLKMGEALKVPVDADLGFDKNGGHLVLSLRVKTPEEVAKVVVGCEVPNPLMP